MKTIRNLLAVFFNALNTVHLCPFPMQTLRRFLRSETGMTLPLMAFSLVALTGFVGIAIDTGRMQMVQSKLQFSLDAAGLAAGSTVSTASINSEMTKYLAANFNGYMGATVIGSSVTANTANTVFTLSATATLPTTFMGTVGIKTITITANSQVSRAVTGIELVLVLDNTGSMSQSAGGSVTKIQALQTAATALVNSLFSAGNGNGKLWVGIVPFSDAVNIGTSHTTWLGNVNATLNSGWNGCVDARQNGYDVTDEPPSQGSPSTLFNMRSYTQCVTTYNRCKSGVCVAASPTCSTSGGHTCTLISPTCTTVASCTVSSTTTCTPTGLYTFATLLASGTSTYGQPPACSQQVTPLTNNSTTLLNAISTLSANGNTVISQGMQWGWNMLSPRWQGQWGGTMNANGLPLAYNTPGMAKAIVLLTDGENTISDSAQGAYWYLSNGWTGSTNGTTAVSNMDNKVLQICNAMKAQGIYIYTIGLGTSGGINTAELQSCATAVNYAFLSPTTTQLDGIFSSIGDSLSNLRVSK